jgi:hypothetical protein
LGNDGFLIGDNCCEEFRLRGINGFEEILDEMGFGIQFDTNKG